MGSEEVTKKPKFKMNDKIQNSGCPSSVYIVTNVQTNTDITGNFYCVETPAGEEYTYPCKEIDALFVKNASEFNRQYDKEVDKEMKEQFGESE